VFEAAAMIEDSPTDVDVSATDVDGDARFR
jgi:hypothetical protein